MLNNQLLIDLYLNQSKALTNHLMASSEELELRAEILENIKSKRGIWGY
jgi:hypothetical protein